MGKTHIEWTATRLPDGRVLPGYTFNPWMGCSKVSEACRSCYASNETPVRVLRSKGIELWGDEGQRKRTSTSNWNLPYKWNREAEASGIRRRVFCASLADVFEDRPELFEWRLELWDIIFTTPHLDWLLLTKRPENLIKSRFVPWIEGLGKDGSIIADEPWTNVWMGVTAETQQRAEQRIPHLLKVPATIHFLSCEPLLEVIDLTRLDDGKGFTFSALSSKVGIGLQVAPNKCNRISWVIGGGESGHTPRLCQSQYARSLRDQCEDSGTAFFWKQWGEFLPDDQNTEIGSGTGGIRIGKKAAGRLLDGREWSEFPAVPVPAAA